MTKSNDRAAGERPITMQDVRLATGEGKLTPADVLAGCNAELRRRHRLSQAPAAEAGEDDDCPHCGAAGYPDIEYQKGNDPIHPYRVVCKKCGCGTAWHGDYQAASKSWRRRAALSSASVGAGEPVAWQWRSRIKGGAWDAWENGRYGQTPPPFMDVEERALYASPATPTEQDGAG